MKILWFTNTPSLYDQGKHHYHGGGWIESLELLIKEQAGIDLAVSFFHKIDSKKVVKNGTTYFPILQKSAKRNPFQTVLNNLRGKFEEDNLNDKFLQVVNAFKPDIIHVFGTEGPFSKIQEFTKIPVVIHIQGVINPYLNTYYPVNQSDWNFLLNKNYFFNNLIGNSPPFGRKRFATQAKREQDFLSSAKYVMGRTYWDNMLAKLYNPNVKYFHIDEVLRPAFYQKNFISKKRQNHQFKIISTLSPTVYKGIDLVLKAAKQIKELTDFEFQWEIIGLKENAKILKHFEKTEKIKHQEVNIKCCGRKGPVEIIELMQSADVFVHPSYIDNSPNSVCEAQILGLPVIACNVGGVSSLVQHKETGFLVPSNGLFELVHYLNQFTENEDLRMKIGEEGKNVASRRHNREKIITSLIEVYKQIHNQNARPSNINL